MRAGAADLFVDSDAVAFAHELPGSHQPCGASADDRLCTIQEDCYRRGPRTSQNGCRCQSSYGSGGLPSQRSQPVIGMGCSWPLASHAPCPPLHDSVFSDVTQQSRTSQQSK